MTGEERIERIAPTGRDVALPLEAGRHVFELQEGARVEKLCLTSRYAVPAQVNPGASSDTRMLGAAVQRILIDEQDIALDSPLLTDGWYGREGASRWTNGCALIDVREWRPRRVAIELDPRRPCLSSSGQPILPPDRTIAMAFESLGDNCEFGMFQRRLGAEPLSFLRFSGARLPNLLRGISEEFSHIGDLSASVLGTEYMIQVKSYDCQYHSGRHTHEVTSDQVLAEQRAKLEFQRQAFFEDLRDPYKLYVFKQNELPTQGEVETLLGALREYGPCSLLWVTERDQGAPAGHVELLANGFMRAYIDRFATRESAGRFSTQGWLLVMRAAYAMWTGHAA